MLLKRCNRPPEGDGAGVGEMIGGVVWATGALRPDPQNGQNATSFSQFGHEVIAVLLIHISYLSSLGEPEKRPLAPSDPAGPSPIA